MSLTFCVKKSYKSLRTFSMMMMIYFINAPRNTITEHRSINIYNDVYKESINTLEKGVSPSGLELKKKKYKNENK